MAGYFVYSKQTVLLACLGASRRHVFAIPNAKTVEPG
jgi:hypothetical protein